MAYIERCVRGYGVCYVIRTNITNYYTKQKIRKCKTWRVPKGMNAKDAQKEVKRIAVDYEKEIEELIYIGFDISKITIRDFSVKYLEFIKDNYSISHYIRSKELLKYMNSEIGNLCINSINPLIVQNYFDKIDKQKRVINHIVPKPRFKEILYCKYHYSVLINEYKIQHYTLLKAFKGLNVSEKWARTLCERTNIPFEELFVIKKEIGDYSFRTKHQKKIILRQLLAFAKKRRVVKENYALSSYVFYTRNKEKQNIKIMNKQEALEFYDELMRWPKLKVKVALLLFLLTGIRRAEATGLKWSDIDIQKRRIIIRRNVLCLSGYGIVEKETKTTGSTRTITISEQLCELLIEYKKKQNNKKNNGNWLFIRKDGNVIGPDTFLIWLRKVLKSAGLPNYTLHSLRHTNITLQLLNGVPITVVSARAGHSSPSTTFNFYSHYLVGEDGVAVETLDSIFKQTKSDK